MKQKLFLTFSGLFCGLFGIYISYLFLKSINEKANILFFIISLFLFTMSVISLILATRSKKTELIIDRESAYLNTAMTIQKNNNKFEEWDNSNSKRDKLKILKMSAEIEESK